MLTLLTTSILTDFGTYDYRPITLEEARRLATEGVQSAISHQATAEILTGLLGVEVPVNRMVYQQRSGEKALVFKLKGRLPEGAVLNRRQIEEIGYTLGLLERRGKPLC